MGSAGMRAAVKKSNKSNLSKHQKDMRRFGLVENQNKKAPDPGYLRQYRDPKVEEPERYRPSSAASVKSTQNSEMNHYDHHDEIYQAKKEMERAEQEQRMSEMADDENTGARYEQELQEFDSLNMDKKQEGELIMKNNKYMSKEDEAIDLAQINVREASDTQLIFRKLPFAIWIFGFLICLMGLYLIYHLALGHYGVLFKGFRE